MSAHRCLRALPPPVGNYAKDGTDLDSAVSTLPGVPASALSAVTTTGTDSQGRLSSASGQVEAAAWADFGAPHVESSGAGLVVHSASSDGRSSGSAGFSDYLRFSSTSGGPIQVGFGMGVEGSTSFNSPAAAIFP